MLPRLREVFGTLDQVNEDITAARHELNLHEAMWGERLDDETMPDAQHVRELMEKMQTLIGRGRDLEGELYRSGCQLKDFRNGLIDFYHVRDEQLVFLCWQRDEPQITAWHPMDCGYEDRRSLNGCGPCCGKGHRDVSETAG